MYNIFLLLIVQSDISLLYKLPNYMAYKALTINPICAVVAGMEINMERFDKNGIPILARVDFLFLSGTEADLKKAAELTKGNKKVLIAIQQTYLPTDIVKMYQQNPEAAPVIRKKEAEAFCDSNEIQILYGVIEVMSFEAECGIAVLLAAKGGLYAVLCRQLHRGSAYKKNEESYYCGVFIENSESGKREVISASFQKSAEKTIAENLYEARSQIIYKCIEMKNKNGFNLRLGRFFELYPHVKDTDYDFGKKVQLKERTLKLPKDINFNNEWSGRLGYETLALSADIKVKEEDCDVLVIGGGTAGVMAAIYAARNGAKTTLVEWQYDLGGTSTIGGVNAYWFGNRYKPVTEVDEATYALYEQLGVQENRQSGFWSKYDEFHSGLRSHVLFSLCLGAGVNILLGQQVYGVTSTSISSKSESCREVISAGAEGNVLHCAKIVIDATGDGDVAMWFGASTEYGSKRDMITFWASLGQFTDINNYKNNFSSMLYTGDPLDVTRFIRLSRQRGGEPYDHSSYISMRESRHIKGLTQVNLEDACTFKHYEDAMYTCYSNYDPKGKLDADMIYCGWLPPQLKIQIPLSALIPVTPEGEKIKALYVAGKAISASHNVFAIIRMQPDLMQQGAVLGIFVAKAVKHNCLIEDLPAKSRREWIAETGDDLTLPDRMTDDMRFYVNEITEDTRTHWLDVDMVFEEKTQNPYLALLVASPEEALPFIKERLAAENNPVVAHHLKKLVLWHGCDDYTNDLLISIKERLQDGKLPKRTGSTAHTTLLPDHGVMTELTNDMNILAWSKKECNIGIFEQIAKLLERDPRDYYDKEQGIYHYIESFAYVAERTGNKSFLPLIKSLQSFPEFDNAFLKDSQIDLMTERLLILWFRLSGARARLGDRDGYSCLIKLLEVESLSVSLSAAMLLEELLDFSPVNVRNCKAWQAHLDLREEMPIRLVTERCR